MKRLVFAIFAFSLVSACSMNLPSLSFLKFWDDGEAKPVAQVVVADPSRLVFNVAEARLEPVAEGVLLRATGIAAAQGYHSASLVLTATTGSMLSFQLRAIAPEAATRQGGAPSRQLLVARLLTFSELRGVRTIEVITTTRKIVLRNR